MDPEIIAAWISDQHVVLHACDPDACQLPLDYATPPRTAQRRVPFADLDPNDLLRNPRKDRTGHPSPSDHADADADADADTAAYGSDLQATPRPRKMLPQKQPVVPAPMSFTSKLSASDRQSVTPASQRSSGTSSRTRSTSPVKNLNDLLKLEKPVSWTNPDPRTMQDAVKATGSVQALRLFNDIWGVTEGGGYLPRELKGILKEELMVNNARFAADDRVVVVTQERRADAHQLFAALGMDQDQMLGLLALYGELNAIRDIVATTTSFIETPRSEATWNDHIHGPILRLAMSSNPDVGAENITQATIAKDFVPASRGELETLRGKMIDYALLLRPNRHLTLRIIEFVDGFDGPRTFNQSTHGALSFQPTGVFIETKVDKQGARAEGKTQLGIWLAAWYGRVARFVPLAGDEGTPTNLPFLPVLLVVCEKWELYFAFDRDSEFEVCGPLKIGDTATVDGSYRLLAVLRLLAGWVASEFRGWVERCVA